VRYDIYIYIYMSLGFKRLNVQTFTIFEVAKGLAGAETSRV